MRMRRLGWCALALALGSAAPLAAQPVATSASAPSAGPSQAERIEQFGPQLDAIFERFISEAHVPGLAYGIVVDGRLAYVQTMGHRRPNTLEIVTPDTLFRIASMSKAFTALAILKLRDEGRISLDALAETYVPELRTWRYPTADSPRIKVRDLLNHAAGFVDDNPWGDRQQVMSEADFTRLIQEGVPFARAPGVAYEYSNLGYALLGRIVTNVSGMPYDQYITRNIMRPLGMNSTGYEVTDAPLDRRAIGYRYVDGRWEEEPTMRHGAFGAMGGVQTSARDYARWIAFLLSAWPARDDPETGPARRASVREMAHGSNFPQSDQRQLPSGQPCHVAGAYGMGLSAEQDCELGTILSHSGGYPGYGSHMLLLPDRGVGLFAFANGTYAAPVPQLVEAAARLHRAGLIPTRAVPPSPALTTAYRAAGAVYAAGDLGPARQLLAMNFLMDRSEERWRRELARLREQVGQCRTDAPIRTIHNLLGSFNWTCERGTLRGNVMLAPTSPAGIQALRFRAERSLAPTPALAPAPAPAQ